MVFATQRSRSARKTRRVINIHQNKFTKAYVSTIDNSRRLHDSLSDMMNMEVVQDNVVQPRPPMMRYGAQPDIPVIGRGNLRYGGVRSLLFMMNDSGTGKIYKQTDGEDFEIIDDGGVYDDEAWAGFVQSKGKSYVFNGVDNLSFIDLSNDSINVYSSLATPGTPTVTKSGMTGTAFPHYYRITANNEVGESIASTAGTTTSGKVRDSWLNQTDFMTITWSAVTGAVSYTIYYGSSAADCKELYTVAGQTTTSFVDYGSLAVNPFKLAPEGNSTEGAVFNWMYVDTKNSQIFGITNDNKLYYSAPGTGDFSPYNGGGWVAIDENGDTQLNYVDGFRNGKGDPVITVSARGAAGKGKLFHVTFEQLTIGDQIIVYPNVYEANGQTGAYSARGVVKARDALQYFTGQDVKSTGTSQNIMNILTTSTISQVIEPDMQNIDLANLHKSVGVEYRDRIYWSLPVNSSENSEIWYLDLSRRNLWVLRWPVAAKDLWLYEDSAGITHFCALVDNKVLEFTRAGATPHQDDGEPFSSRVAFESLTWDEDGMNLASIRNMYFKLLQPKGTINANAYGLTRKGLQEFVGADRFSSAASTSFTGIGQFDYSGDYMYGDDPGEVVEVGKNVSILHIKPKGLLNQLDWEVTANTTGTDYILSAVNTRGFAYEDLVLKTNR